MNLYSTVWKTRLSVNDTVREIGIYRLIGSKLMLDVDSNAAASIPTETPTAMK